jgi:hypothetical protein
MPVLIMFLHPTLVVLPQLSMRCLWQF